jgi:molybdopterin-guanine dinucleotide biosynthesis protein A
VLFKKPLKAAPRIRMAQAEILFEAGPLAGMRLTGISIEPHKWTSTLAVDLPKIAYRAADGTERKWKLSRGATDDEAGQAAEARVRQLIVNAFSKLNGRS